MDVPPVCLQGAVCHQSCSAMTAHAICRAIVKWNIFYISSNGFSLLINWVYVVCIFQDPSQGRTFQKLPTTALPGGEDKAKRYRCGVSDELLNGISVIVETGNIIRLHMFIKYGERIRATTTAVSCLDTREYSSIQSWCSSQTWKLCVRRRSWVMTACRQPEAMHLSAASFRKDLTFEEQGKLCHVVSPTLILLTPT